MTEPQGFRRLFCSVLGAEGNCLLGAWHRGKWVDACVQGSLSWVLIGKPEGNNCFWPCLQLLQKNYQNKTRKPKRVSKQEEFYPLVARKNRCMYMICPLIFCDVLPVRVPSFELFVGIGVFQICSWWFPAIPSGFYLFKGLWLNFRVYTTKGHSLLAGDLIMDSAVLC